jgi:peptide/nickel transport system substrate-binding protein
MISVTACQQGGTDAPPSSSSTTTASTPAASTPAAATSAAAAPTAAPTTTAVAAVLSEQDDKRSPTEIIREWVEPVIVDQFNPDVTDGTRGGEGKRGGEFRVRTPSDFGNLNPITSTSQPDRLVQNLMFESLVTQSRETLEEIPRIAWTYSTADLLKTKDGEVQKGILLELGDEKDPNSAVIFVPDARIHTFIKTDVASYDVANQTLTLKPEWGGATFEGSIIENDFTLVINEGEATSALTKHVSFKISDLDTWTDRIGGEDVQRAWRKRECAFWFTLREGPTWHDGRPVTADDVKFSFETILNPTVQAQHLRNYYQDVEKCEVMEDGRTVYFESRKPYFQQFSFLGGIYLVPRHAFNPERFGGDETAFGQAFNDAPYRTRPIGNGPYRFVEWRQGRDLTVERYPDYWASKLPSGTVPLWNPAMPYFDRIVHILIPDKSAAQRELETGGVDADMDIEPDTWAQASTQTEQFTSKIVRSQHLGFLYTFIALNNNNPIFKDPATRRAMAYLVPRDRTAKDVYYDLAIPVTGPFFVGGPGYDRTVEQIPYDPEEAKRLLRRAGWLDRTGDGVLEKEIDGVMVPFEFEYLIHTARDYHEKVADIYKEAIEQVGIRMTIRKLDFSTLLDKTRNQDFDASRQAWGTTLDPDPYQIWHSSQSMRGGSNYVSYRNEQADRLMEQLREEFFPPRRWEIARELHRIISGDQPVIFLEGFQQTYFYSRGIQGVKLYSSVYPYDFTEWWWADESRRK